MIDGTIYKRLEVKPDNLIYFPNGHETIFRSVRASMPQGVRIRRKLGPDEKADLIFVWPEPGGEWIGLFKVLKALLLPSGAIWAIIPRKEVALAKETRVLFGDVQNAALKAGFVDNKISRVNERECGVRFVRRARQPAEAAR